MNTIVYEWRGRSRFARARKSSEQSIAIIGAKLASSGKLWRMAPDSIDAIVQVDKKPEVQVEEQTLGPLHDTITVRGFSVNIYFYPV